MKRSNTESNTAASKKPKAKAAAGGTSPFAVHPAPAPDAVHPSRCKTLKQGRGGAAGHVVYWMERDLRSKDNWALLKASFISANNVSAVVTDYNPLRHAVAGRQQLLAALAARADCSVEMVDAHNIVPVEVASDKQEFAARTIRKKITSRLPELLSEFPPLPPRVADNAFPARGSVDWRAVAAAVSPDESSAAVRGARVGEAAAAAALRRFVQEGLPAYAARNDPNADAQSGLSPYLHFGFLSPQRAALAALEVREQHRAEVYSFLEELIVRRELSDNFCHYNAHYGEIAGTSDFARKTLAAHAADRREHRYDTAAFERAATHDDLWNAAQRQLVREGKMHGFLRMYWAKKVLEWTESPEEALRVALWLNDKYSLDGRDPNGVVGVMWSVAGLHDQGWGERPVFGKIRYMNYKGCERKFDVKAFVDKYAH